MAAGIKLVRPDARYRESYLAALQEYWAEGRVPARSDVLRSAGFDAFVESLRDMEIPECVEPGFVPQTTFWLVDDTEYLGRLSIRHHLTNSLREVGGHIGYDIRPARRREGLGQRQLALGLIEARRLGLDRVLLTCDAGNVGSRRIIEKNGGVVETPVIDLLDGEAKLRFWIELHDEADDEREVR